MATFEKCGLDVEKIASDLIASYYSDLKECEVKITYLYAFAARNKDGEPKGDAIKTSSGLPALAKVERTNLKDRVLGKADVVMSIDGDKWKCLSSDRQVALIDHELYHIVVRRDKEMNVLSDDIGRPLVEMRKHDWEITGFKEIAKRHGDSSIEVVGAKSFRSQFGEAAFNEVGDVGVADGDIEVGVAGVGEPQDDAVGDGDYIESDGVDDLDGDIEINDDELVSSDA